MRHPLDGSRLKVVRAQEHIDSLKAEIGMYLNEKPYEFPTQAESNAWVVRPGIRSHPPIRLSTIVGDCLGNARAALDYIAWQIALRYFVPPLNVKSSRDRYAVAFPLTPKEVVKRLDAFADRKVPAAICDEIRAVQPHNAGYEPLEWLHKLVNDDKHRLPVLVMGVLGGIDISIAELGDNVDPPMRASGTGGRDVGVGYYGFINPNLPTNDPTSRDRMQVDTEGTGYVALEDGLMPDEPVERTLEKIVKTVANVVPLFDPFF